MKISRRNFCLLMAGACCTGVLAACGSSSSSTASSSAASASAAAKTSTRGLAIAEKNPIPVLLFYSSYWINK